MVNQKSKKRKNSPAKKGVGDNPTDEAATAKCLASTSSKKTSGPKQPVTKRRKQNVASASSGGATAGGADASEGCCDQGHEEQIHQV